MPMLLGGTGGGSGGGGRSSGGGGGGKPGVEGEDEGMPVNLNTLRTLRVLRPLKLVSGVPSKRKRKENEND